MSKTTQCRSKSKIIQCRSKSKITGRCELEQGHEGPHATAVYLWDTSVDLANELGVSYADGAIVQRRRVPKREHRPFAK